jgi:alkanesulfonate monooxygenase SsuD/methylene tetrahydromethanopterin reductase-like flavin-dependent oxidoreductase (luciferase family)
VTGAAQPKTKSAKDSGHYRRLGSVSREDYDTRASAEGPLFVGSPQEIVDKISWEHELFGHQRYIAQVDIGGQPYAMVARTLELLGGKVLPAVRNLGR